MLTKVITIKQKSALLVFKTLLVYLVLYVETWGPSPPIPSPPPRNMKENIFYSIKQIE